jgi:hypothetical protein
MGVVVLGVSGIKTGRRRRFGYFGRGELETTDLRLGIGVHSSVYPYFDGFWSLVVGVLLVLGGYELARSETEWINLSIGLSYTPPCRA